MFFDINNIIKLDCWNIGGFYGKLTTNLGVIPLLMLTICMALYYTERRTIGFVIKAGGADESAYVTATVKLKHNLFLGIFLLYPTITTTLFRSVDYLSTLFAVTVFQCGCAG